MDIYYKRVERWHPWPDNDQMEYDMVHFSKSKRKFEDNVFLKLDPQTPVPERKDKVGAFLKVNPKKINLVKS